MSIVETRNNKPRSRWLPKQATSPTFVLSYIGVHGKQPEFSVGVELEDGSRVRLTFNEAEARGVANQFTSYLENLRLWRRKQALQAEGHMASCRTVAEGENYQCTCGARK